MGSRKKEAGNMTAEERFMRKLSRRRLCEEMTEGQRQMPASSQIHGVYVPYLYVHPAHGRN